MMRRFTSAPNPAVRVAVFIAADVVAVDPQPVAHAVVAGEVRRRLGRRDQVVRRQAVGELGHRDLLDLGPGLGQGVGRLVHPGRHVGRAALDEVAAQPDAHTLHAACTGAGSARAPKASEVLSSGSCPARTSNSSAASVDRRRRTARSGRASSQTPPARSARHGRRWASSRRRRRARPAGGWSRPCRSPGPAGRSPPPPRQPSRHCCRPGPCRAQRGLRVGPKAEFSVEQPMANSSMFVLPNATAPAASQELDDGGVVGRPPSLEDPRAAGRRRCRGCTGCPSAPPAPRPAGPGPGPAPPRRRPRRPGPAPRRRGPRGTRGTRRCRRRPPPAPPRRPRGPSAPRSGRRPPPSTRAASWRLAADPRHPEAVVLHVRRHGQHLVAVEARPGLVGSQHVLERDRMDDGARWERSSEATSAAWSSTVRSCAGEQVDLLVGQGRDGPGWPHGRRRPGSAVRGPLVVVARLTLPGSPAGGSTPLRNFTVRASISSLS